MADQIDDSETGHAAINLEAFLYSGAAQGAVSRSGSGLGNYNAIIGAANFGQITSATPNEFGPRTVQVSARIIF